MKQYKLKKDLPNVKAGAILHWNSTETWVNGPYKGGRYGFMPMPSDKSCDIIFTPEDVENNTEWFEEIETIEIIATLMPLEYKNIRFPCLCVPYFDGRNNEKKYRWEHAGVVDSVVRGAADYFDLVDIHVNTNK